MLGPGAMNSLYASAAQKTLPTVEMYSKPHEH
jgi:hypothetical protein